MGGIHEFLSGPQVFNYVLQNQWAVQLTVKEPTDLFVLTGEDFHPAFGVKDTIVERYGQLRGAARDGLVGIPVAIIYGLITEEQMNADGTRSVTRIFLPNLTPQQQSAATAVLVTFYRLSILAANVPARATSPTSDTTISSTRREGDPHTNGNKETPQHNQGSGQPHSWTSVQYSQPSKQNAIGNNTAAERVGIPTNRLALLSIKTYNSNNRHGVRGIPLKPGFFETDFAFPVTDVAAQLERMRLASLRQAVYKVAGESWIPPRRRTRWEPTRHDRGMGQPNRSNLKIKRLAATGFEVDQGVVGFTEEDVEDVAMEQHVKFDQTLSLVDWDYCEGGETQKSDVARRDSKVDLTESSDVAMERPEKVMSWNFSHVSVADTDSEQAMPSIFGGDAAVVPTTEASTTVSNDELARTSIFGGGPAPVPAVEDGQTPMDIDGVYSFVSHS